MPSVKSLPVVFIALALVLFCNYALPQQPGSAKTQSEQEPTYKPPIRGAPASRVGGGSRGAGDNTPYLAVVAPDHTGFTLDEQPNLYWYLSTRATARVEITVIDDVSVKPLLEKQLETPVGPGMQHIRLQDMGIRLKPGVEYRWHVAIVLDPVQRSNDILASGTIKQIIPTEATRARLARAQGSAAVLAYAEEGIWYDCFASLMQQMRLNPADDGLRRQYRSLLRQVGLTQIAEAQ